jgi:hypothetical protein
MVPKLEVSLLTRKSIVSQTGRFQGHVGLNCCPPTAVVSPDLLFPSPSTSSAVKTPENIEEGPDYPEVSDEGDIQMEYSC